MTAPRIIGGDLLTGRVRIGSIPVRGQGTKMTQNLGVGSVTGVVHLPAKDPTTGLLLDVPSIIVPGKSFIGYDQDGTLMEAGPVWVDETDIDSANHTMQALGIESMFSYRYVLQLLQAGQLPRDVTATFTGLDLRTQAKRLVQLAQQWNPTLPIVLEADIAGSNDRSYYGADLLTVAEALDNIRNVIGGPEIVFRPRYKAGTGRQYVEWVMSTGNPLYTQSPAPDLAWDTSVVGSTVKGTKIKRDATYIVTDSFVNGGTLTPAQVVDYASNPVFATDASGVSITDTGATAGAGAVCTVGYDTTIGKLPGLPTSAKLTFGTGSANAWQAYVQALTSQIPAISTDGSGNDTSNYLVFNSLWVYTTVAATLALKIMGFQNADGSGTNTVLLTGPAVAVPANTWTRLTVNGSVPVGYLSVRPMLSGVSSTTGQIIYMDDDTLTPNAVDPGDLQTLPVDFPQEAISLDETVLYSATLESHALNPRFGIDAYGALVTIAGTGGVWAAPAWQSGAGNRGPGYCLFTATTGPSGRFGLHVQPLSVYFVATNVVFLAVWVNPSITTTLRARITSYTDAAGTTGAAVIDGADVSCPAGVWTRLTVTGTLGAGVLSSRPGISGASYTTAATIAVDDATYVLGSLDPGDFNGGDANDLSYDYVWKNPQQPDHTASIRKTRTGYWRMQAADAHESATEDTTLQAWATGATTEGRNMLQTWSFQVRRLRDPKLQVIQAGYFAGVVVGSNNPRLLNGKYRVRIMQVDADMGPWVVITCAPERLV